MLVIMAFGFLVTTVVLGTAVWAEANLHRVAALTDYPERPAAGSGTNWLLVGSDSRGDLTPEQQAELLHQVDVGHCGALPQSMLAPMALAQRARDAALALAMVQAARQAAPGARVVLIAGNGHVRRDLGVPHDLAVLDAAARVLSVAFLELEDGRPGAVDGPYDAAWFTPRAERADPCADFKPPVAKPG